MLETMNLHVGTLKERIEELVRGLRVGFTDPSMGDLEYEDDSKDKDSVENMQYSQVIVDTKRKEFDAETHVHNTVYAVESLLGLISQLKNTYITRAPYRDSATLTKKLATRFRAQSARISSELEALGDEVTAGMKELEEVYTNSTWTKCS
uniref:Uncharacterized protein n=1 Tax=Lotharella globosa TaxID=91324 RepID=A0A7S3Z7G7_9EUKA|mmetsp:Transcript_17148/g.32630  ORF Transcript_17148/g.32630 Transcript_17148/m.32630 type:complete len:150 (+) Transcript_17148:42-491(+)